MRSYGANWFETLVKLRLPAAMPFIFNALKINSTLAMIAPSLPNSSARRSSAWAFAFQRKLADWGWTWSGRDRGGCHPRARPSTVSWCSRTRVTFWHPSYRK